ncbi:urease accessory protein UreE [Pseudorhodoplanes sp.]|uniref:urease accessory protein UreE n=1 Tax=Pseudorhodoplanes sp. TaxID=1934341 RepID=UPI002BBA14FA|nr:urease accessory protein UreE [Pseudorhodoplanes sp.]HWV42511.1 urease accessory protein UreE [Pseudorhodoplanes sp.]
MVRAVSLLSAHEGRPVRDVLILSAEQRRLPSGIVTGLRGTEIALTLPAGTRLRQDDILLLDDGGIVDIVARPEPLLEVRTADLVSLARAAWLLGDHHIPVEIHGRYLRLMHTEAAANLLRPLGASVRVIEAPFEPEGGAYEHSGDNEV